MRTRMRKLLTLALILAGVATALWFASMQTTPQAPNLIFTGFKTNELGPSALIRLTNAGPRSISYWGYETNSPWYSYRFQESGYTTNHCPLRCGNGLQQCVLP